jgi:hypothetical protein
MTGGQKLLHKFWAMLMVISYGTTLLILCSVRQNRSQFLPDGLRVLKYQQEENLGYRNSLKQMLNN